MTNKIISQAQLKNLLEYDPNTGEFVWVASKKIAGSLMPHGYIRIVIQKQKYYAHRLAWLYVYGYTPPNSIDHIDRRKNNNRISNLRLATQSENAQNQSLRKNNLSGYVGVSFDKRAKKWSAYIMVKRRKFGLGNYCRLIDAVNARKQAEFQHHSHRTL
jgi:hypothetical protein